MLKDVSLTKTKNKSDGDQQSTPKSTMKKIVTKKKSPPPATEADSDEKKDDDMKMTLLVSSVQDLFQDLGTLFIEACLKRFDMNPEKVIQMILDDNLPPDIQNMDRLVS